jgi:hypothetical protein
VWCRRLGRVPEAPCWKVRYGNGALAHRALQAIVAERAARPHDGPVEQRAFPCPRCGFWHLTHAPLRRTTPAADGCAQPDGP